jgi:hypothetical protein
VLDGLSKFAQCLKQNDLSQISKLVLPDKIWCRQQAYSYEDQVINYG